MLLQSFSNFLLEKPKLARLLELLINRLGMNHRNLAAFIKFLIKIGAETLIYQYLGAI